MDCEDEKENSNTDTATHVPRTHRHDAKGQQKNRPTPAQEDAASERACNQHGDIHSQFTKESQSLTHLASLDAFLTALNFLKDLFPASLRPRVCACACECGCA